jgi:hypothetical protein
VSPKRDSISIHLELIPGEGSTWGWTYAMDGVGGCGPGGLDQLTCLLKVYQQLRKEVKRAMETRQEKADRLDKRKEAIRRAKSKGLIP